MPDTMELHVLLTPVRDSKANHSLAGPANEGNENWRGCVTIVFVQGRFKESIHTPNA